jgi:hypothetical protein
MDKRKKSCILIIIIALVLSGFILIYRATNTASADTESGWKMIFYKSSDSWYGLLVCDKTSSGAVGTIEAEVTIDGKSMDYSAISPRKDSLGLFRRYLIGADKKVIYPIMDHGDKPKSATAYIKWNGNDTDGIATIEFKE